MRHDVAKVKGFTLTDIDRHFQAIENITIRSMERALKRTTDRFQPFVVATSSVGLAPEDVAVITQYWSEEVNGEISAYIGEVYRGSAIHVAVGIADAFPAGKLAGLPLIPDSFTAIFLQTIQGQFVNVIGNDLWESARTILVDGVQQGQSMEQIAERLQTVDEFTARRAMVVARTSVHAASESGSISQLRHVGYSNETVSKEWINTHDTRTRPTHVAAGDQIVQLNEKFVVGEALLDFPGDPLGPPAEIYNCRCTAVFDINDPPTVSCNGETICIQSDTVIKETKQETVEIISDPVTTPTVAQVNDWYAAHLPSPEQLEDIRRYKGAHFNLLNGLLRADSPSKFKSAADIPQTVIDYLRNMADSLWADSSDEQIATVIFRNSEKIESIRKAMAPIPNSFLLLRGTTLREFGGRIPKVGDKYVGKSFLSTTHSERVASIFGNDATDESPQVLLSVEAPKGTKAVSIPGYEDEILLHDGLTYEIKQVFREGNIVRVFAQIVG